MLLSKKTVATLLCSAFEGGTNYWAMIVGYKAPEKLTFRSDETTVFPHIDYPLNNGGVVIVADMETGERHELTSDKVAKGLEVLKAKIPHQFKAAVDGNDDATTGDCLVQCALFGDVIFG